MKNREKTKLKFGYFPEDLSPSSLKPIIWDCSGCGSTSETAYGYFLKKEKKTKNEEKDIFCQKCCHAHRKGKAVVKQQKSKPQPLPPQVDYAKTMEAFGINADDLSPWSREQIFMKCGCGKESLTKRCSLNTYKSIVETGEFKCTGCWTKTRRTGAKASEATRQKMRNSQQKRRSPLPLKKAVGDDYIPSVATSSEGGIVINFPNKDKK